MKKLLLFVLSLLIAFSAVACSAPLKESDLTEPDGENAAENTEPASDSKTAERETEEGEAPDHKEDEEMNIILIGNSYSYYWCDELYGMLAAIGHEDARVYNVYYSGCTFEKHWNWLLLGEANYSLFLNDKNGRREEKNVSLRTCLAKENWDIIGLQQSGRYVYGNAASEDNLRRSVEAHLPQLYGFLFKEFPKAAFFWQQSWAHEIGNGVANLEEQKSVTSWHRIVGKEVCAQYGFTRVPCGDAWEAVRHHPLIREDGLTLTARSRKGAPYDDLTHDGDRGGGQYLNACVWFERITGQSPVGNPFRPHYTVGDENADLSEEKIALLQNAAHIAVLEMEKEA